MRRTASAWAVAAAFRMASALWREAGREGAEGAVLLRKECPAAAAAAASSWRTSGDDGVAEGWEVAAADT